jgi:hypothetical protein
MSIVMCCLSSILAGYVPFPTAVAASTHKAAGPLTQLASVHIPGAPSTGWCRDVAATSAGRYYLADDTNNQLSVVSIQQDGRKDHFVGAIAHGDFNGPAGCLSFDFSLEAPEGVLAYQGKLWVSNVRVNADGTSHSQVLVFDENTGQRLQTIDTGGQKRTDEMTVIPPLGLIAVTNPDETFAQPSVSPWLNFISTSTYQVVAKLPFTYASSGVSGLQQPEWIGGKEILIDVPSPVGNVNGGELDRISISVSGGRYLFHVQRFPLKKNCQPAGLSLNYATGLAAVGCGFVAPAGSASGNQLIWNFRTNQVVKYIPGVQGVDIVATTDNGLFLFPSYITNILYVTDAGGNILQQISTSDGAHTVNFDSQTGQVFVPTGGGNVAVYGTGGKMKP